MDLAKGEAFGFLGFDFRRVRSKRGVWRPQYTPKLKKRTALLQKLKEVFRHFQSQPVTRVIEQINPVLRGWVNYFAIGHSSRCFSYVRDWVEKKVRRHLMRARNRPGFGWKRWSRRWLYATLGLHAEYHVKYFGAAAESAPHPIGPITLGAKRTGERSAGNPHARFDVAGAGDGPTATPTRARSWKRRTRPRGYLRGTAPALDPTDEGMLAFGSRSELVRHRQTKGAGTDRLGLLSHVQCPTLPPEPYCAMRGVGSIPPDTAKHQRNRQCFKDRYHSVASLPIPDRARWRRSTSSTSGVLNSSMRYWGSVQTRRVRPKPSFLAAR